MASNLPVEWNPRLKSNWVQTYASPVFKLSEATNV